MWLPETAVDHQRPRNPRRVGIRFTILAPHQAGRVRRIGDSAWHDVSGGRIDPTRAYEQRLPSGRKIALFFYDGPVSRAVAFEGLLSRGEDLAHRLLGVFSDERDWPQLAHIATDGESYGHHHRFGDMALAYALNTHRGESIWRGSPTTASSSNDIPRPTKLKSSKKPPGVVFTASTAGGATAAATPAAIPDGIRNGAGRCVMRWTGCATRSLLPFEKLGHELLKDPWAARNDYISVVLDRSAQNVERFFCPPRALAALPLREKTTALKLLEMQRHAMLMYTSCGWFFDELSGIETVQVMQYAGRAVQLAQELFGDSLESQFIERLAAAKSNLPEPATAGAFMKNSSGRPR